MSLAPWILLLFPALFGGLFFLVRMGFLWLEREQVALHTRRIYVRSLLYAKDSAARCNYQVLALRQAFYGTFFAEKKVYLPFLHRLKDFTSHEDTQLEESYEFLEHTKL